MLEPFLSGVSLLSPQALSSAWAQFHRFGPPAVRVVFLRVLRILSMWRVSHNWAEAQGNRSRDTYEAKIALVLWVRPVAISQ